MAVHTQFEVNEDFRVMENEELVYMLTNKDDSKESVTEDLFNHPNASAFFDVVAQMTPARRKIALAAVELYKRLKEKQNPVQIQKSEDVFYLMKSYLGDIVTEECWVILLNSNRQVLKKIRISCGGFTSAQVDIRVILREALINRAVAFILCHNHPSGTPRPSMYDNKLTDAVSKAAQTINLKLFDHVIVTSSKYYSYSDEGHI